MNPPFPPSPRTIQALLPQVVDSFQAQGFSCRHRISHPGMVSGGCVQLLCVRQIGKACLANTQLQNASSSHGCCLNANLTSSLCVEYLLDGRRCCAETTLCLPIRGIFRMNCETACEFCPLLQLKCTSLSLAGGCLELCFDFCAIVYALCQALVCLPCPQPLEPDCSKFFSMPLYPSYRTPPC